MDIALFDYGTGNLHSLAKALQRNGGSSVRMESDAARAVTADALVLPGVGAFGAAAERLAPGSTAIAEALARGLPCLAICLGMQLLFESSEEGDGRGIGAFPGTVRRLHAPRVPHMGWNTVETTTDAIFAGVEDLVAYYANSYVAAPLDPGEVIGWTEYGRDRFPAAVRRWRTWGVQFHPEKSGAQGLRLIENFLTEAAR
jgi:glutamine amidotransferase